MVYRKLERVWSNNNVNYRFLHDFKNKFPELSKLDSEELCDRFSDLNMDFYYEKKTEVNNLVRLTLPFAIILVLLMFILLPITFMITGKWGFPITEKNKIYNWFKILKLT